MAFNLPPKFVIIDVETTGFYPEKGDTIIEVAGQKIEGRKVVAEFESFISLDRPLPEEQIKIHGITDEILEQKGRPADQVIPDFVKFIGPATLVGHNILFDLAFLNKHLEMLNLPKLENSMLDTMVLAKRYIITPSYSLNNIAQYLKVDQFVAHRAMADVVTTREIFWKLVERANK